MTNTTKKFISAHSYGLTYDKGMFFLDLETKEIKRVCESEESIKCVSIAGSFGSRDGTEVIYAQVPSNMVLFYISSNYDRSEQKTNGIVKVSDTVIIEDENISYIDEIKALIKSEAEKFEEKSRAENKSIIWILENVEHQNIPTFCEEEEQFLINHLQEFGFDINGNFIN